jgi:hypothetical protein
MQSDTDNDDDDDDDEGDDSSSNLWSIFSSHFFTNLSASKCRIFWLYIRK